VGAVPELPADRLADTRVPIHPSIAARWSPRAFDPDAVVTGDQLTALLEAARWAATWGRRQPVRFIVGLRGDQTFAGLAGLLKPGNSYAHAAGALILLCADEGPDEKTARYSGVDAGAAMANLSIEAIAQNLHSHPMEGFNADGARQVFGIPEGVRPLMVIAVGSLGDYSQVSDEIAERDRLPRHRLPLEEIAFAGTWGQPFTAGPHPAPGRPLQL
jgi:nitroreductase